MKIDPSVYAKDYPRNVEYDEACCQAHKNNEIDYSEECEHTHPWED